MSRVWGDDATGGLYVAKAFEDDSLVTSYSGGLSSGADGVGGPLSALVAESENFLNIFVSKKYGYPWDRVIAQLGLGVSVITGETHISLSRQQQQIHPCEYRTRVLTIKSELIDNATAELSTLP
jgi:hypothetical protein